MRYTIAFTLVGLALLLSGCGPTDEEAARAVMMVTPLVYLAGLGLMALMAFLWRKLKPELSLKWKPLLVGLILAIIIGALSFVGVTIETPKDSGWFTSTTDGIEGVMEWFWAALIFYGTSYLTLLLVCWRIWLWRRPATAFSWSWIPVNLLMLLPCLPMILGYKFMGYKFISDFAEIIWIIPGYVGLVTAPLFIIALIEVWVRFRHRKAGTITLSPAGEMDT